MDSIVTRHLTYVDRATGAKKKITISIRWPKTKTKASRRLNLAACTLSVDVPGFIDREITGIDAMQALTMALLHAELFVLTLSQDGKVLLEDESEFGKVEDSVFFGKFREEQQRELGK
jgi:hypothetical protein